MRCHQGQTMLYSRELDIPVIVVAMTNMIFVQCFHTLNLFNEHDYVVC